MPKEKNILSVLADNPALIDALKAVLVKQFEPPVELKSIDANTSDVALGQFLRARIAGLNAVDDAFKEISQYKTVPDTPKRENPAR